MIFTNGKYWKNKKNKHKEQLRNIDDVVMQIMRQLFENMKGAPEEEEYKQRNKPESFLDCDKTKWIQQMKIWLMKQGLPLTESYKKTNGGKGIVQAKTLLYVEHLIDYLVRLKETDVNEIAKDIWGIEKLDIEVKQDLTRVTKIINFEEIRQPDLKEEIKKAVYGLVKNLRKKIEENLEEPYYIETIRGVGYRFRA